MLALQRTMHVLKPDKMSYNIDKNHKYSTRKIRAPEGEFKNFAEFRSEFWKAVAEDPDLASQFKPQNIGRMKEGLAPSVRQSQTLGARGSYEIHHKTPIHDGGGVYDMNNMVIVTPRYHKEILDPAYHFNK